MVTAENEVLETRFVLPQDVLVFPVRSLADGMRATFECQEGDFAVARPRSRRPSSIVDPATASLLEEFRRPSRLIDAVVRFSRGRGIDPQETLQGAFAALRSLCNTRVLVAEGSADQPSIEATFAPGQQLADFEILRVVRALEDTELYQARSVAGGAMVALKVERAAQSAGASGAIEREAAILRHLDGCCAPRLVAQGRHQQRPFLATQWRSGSSIAAAADELRTAREPGRRRQLHALGCRLLEAYELLHRRGVVHGDVHPGNVLVDADGTISLIDFGASRLDGPGSLRIDSPRAAVGYYYDPQTAGAILAGRVPPAASVASDQYALAVLLYRLLTGRHPVDFRAEQEELLRQVVEAPPLPFAQRGVRPWPKLEAVLHRALGKDPGERFPSVAGFRQALASVPPPASTRAHRLPSPALGSAIDRVDAALRRYSLESGLLRQGLETAPAASLWAGAAGIAWFLYRVASIRGEASVLALADAWVTRTELRFARNARAFSTPEQGTADDSVSPFHAASGVHAVAALIGCARGDLGSGREQIAKFVDASSKPSRRLDLVLGRSGSMLAGATLLAAATRLDVPGLEPLRSFLAREASHVSRTVGEHSDVRRCPGISHLGLAHGWAGLLYARLCVDRALGSPAAQGMVEKLEQLAALAQPAGRGLTWPVTLPGSGNGDGAPDGTPDWSSGSAGHVHLWLLAHEAFGDRRHLELAKSAAWAAWEHPDRAASLGHGLAGRALALLRLYQYTGDRAWLTRSRQLLARAPDSPAHPESSLFEGSLGLALLQVELECPEHAVTPLFGA